MKKDPACLMEVDENSALIAECDGVVYYFCSEGCKEKFLKEESCKIPRTSYDLIIVGGGPAGLTAAVYAATLRMDAFLITKDLGGQAIDSTKIENYMGYDFVTGPELIDKFQDQLIHSHYIDHLMSEAEKIERHENGFKVTTSELKEYYARALIIVTGMKRRKLNVQGEEEFQRKGIFYGNIQDLSYVQGESVAVVGGGNSALQMVENLQNVTSRIYLISDAGLTADPVVIERVNRILTVEKLTGYSILSFSGDKTLSNVTVRKKGEDETRILSVKGVFIAIGLQPNSGIVSELVELNEKGEIVIGPDCSTSCSGIFAAGDVTNAFGKRIIIASGEGAKAALAARQYILRQKKTSG
jgi:alkyl hydroperoxide reductase subunit F